MSKEPSNINADSAIGATARSNYAAVSPTIRQALKAQPREISQGVKTIIRKKEAWENARR